MCGKRVVVAHSSCVPKVSHDFTSSKSIDPKESHICNNWLFSVHMVISKFGNDPKESHDSALV